MTFVLATTLDFGLAYDLGLVGLLLAKAGKGFVNVGHGYAVLFFEPCE